jgi:hypothetical protein
MKIMSQLDNNIQWGYPIRISNGDMGKCVKK